MKKLNTRRKLAFSLLFVFCLCSTNFAQFSAYGTVSYGYNQNPLYNYQNQSDQLKQTYLELNYQKDFDYSLLRFSYVSGLMLFNQFSDRNFYEHNFFGRYSIKFLKNTSEKSTANLSGEDSEDSTGVEAAETEETADDSTGNYLDLMAKVGGRYDKDIYREFDNMGSSFLASYKFMPWESFSVRFTNDFGSRKYANIDELSNLTDIFTLQIANKYNGSYSLGLRLSGAYKYYTSTVYDTTKFESERTYKKKPGKGKGGAAVIVPSGKEILLQPQSNGTSQFAAGVFYIKQWDSSNLETDLLYRYNPKTQTRYLAQNSTAGINEDIYNDYFSYQGFEAAIKYNRALFLGIQMSVNLQFAKKNFEAPALDLNGDKISAHRNDLNSAAEIFISRSISLYGGLSVELIAGAGIVRNQSSDDYNDFSCYNFSGGIGIGF